MRRLGRVLALAACMVMAGCEMPAERPSVILVTLDTTRADYIGCYREQGVRGPRDVDAVVSTPTLDAFALEAVLFTNAATPAPLTGPAHASMLTGRYPGGHGVVANGTTPLRPDVPTLTEDLSRIGYRTAAFLSAFVLNQQSGLARGFDVYDDDVVSERPGDVTTELAERWLRSQRGEDPLFLWVHYFDPHRPYEPRDGAPDPYAAEITFVDTQLARLFDALRAAGRYDDALVIVAADHGEGLGDHGEEEHGVFLYDEVIRVPLLVKLPGTSEDVSSVVDASVSLVDLLPTVHDVLEIAPDGRELHGYTLVPLMRGSGARGDGSGQGTDTRAVHLETRYPEMSLGWSRLEGVRTKDWKYVRAPSPEIYALTGDPHERENLATASADTLARLAGIERRIHRRHALGRDAEARADVSDEELERLRSLGYLAPSPAPVTDRALPDPKDMMPLYEHFERGKQLIESDEWESARREFAAILAEAPDNFVALFYAAIAANALDRTVEARAHYRRILDLDPGNAQASYSLGQIHLTAGEHAEAEGLLEVAARDDVYTSRASVLIAQSRDARGDYASAHTYAARGAGPGEVGDRAIRIMGLSSFRLGRLERARGELLEAARRWPEDAAVQAGLGATLMRLGDARAESHFRRAMALEPDNAAHAFNLACFQSVAGEIDDALGSLERAAALGYDDADALASDPDLTAVRADPRFAAIVAKVSERTVDR